MKRLASLLACAAIVLVAPQPAPAQSNDNYSTPLNSRIKRDRQFPTELPFRFRSDEMSKVNRSRSRAMLSQFSKCLYNRSNTRSLDLLARTDFGFRSFEEIGTDFDRAMRIHGFHDCLSRVAYTQSSGVALRFTPGSLRQWLLHEAYFDRYPDTASWVQPGLFVKPREYPLSADNPGVHSAMDFADCVVGSDPYNADYLFRTDSGSPEEQAAIQELMPSLGSCLPEGVQLELYPQSLRVWIGEALWHAANNSSMEESPISEVTP